ncbi:hypothetical protein RV18_GL000494 [Enterococcus termitis]|nr:hypothetical protein RV18_GL000494 [Enterococcus termitis]
MTLQKRNTVKLNKVLNYTLNPLSDKGLSVFILSVKIVDVD